MRTIKFRGKRLDGEWVCGFYQPHANGKVVFIGDYSGLTDIPKLHKVIPESVGQWTGLVDKNGKEIFEGDVVKYNDRKEFIQTVITVPELGTGHYIRRPGAGYYTLNGSVVSEYGVEIIGNIHDNPELMEVE